MCGPLSLSGGVSNHTINLSKFLSDLGVEIVLFNLSGRDTKGLDQGPITKIYQRTFGLFLESIKAKNEYDIIHIQASGGISSFIAAIVGVGISKVLNKRLIVTFHYSKTEIFVKKYKRIFRFLLQSVDTLILVSKSQKDVFQNIFPEFLTKITVVPNGYVPTRYYFRDCGGCRAKLGLPSNKKIILNVSNLIESKGHKYLIKSVHEMLRVRTDILCVIVGRGYMENELKNEVKKLRLGEYVKMVGWVPDDELPIWMGACDVFVLPSLNESFGIVQIEALACGKPVVATYNGGSENILTSEDYGLLCEPKNSQDMSKKILASLRQTWNHLDIITYSKNYSWKEIALETLNIYLK